MRFTSLILALFLATFLAAAALPARAETVADIEAAWRGWMTMNGRGAGGLAVMHRGRLVHQAVMGGEAVSNAVPLASLSKAVTGVCIAGLIDRGRLSFDTPLSQALARTFARLGAPADPRFPGITIGQLLVHRAGFDRAGSSQVEDGDPVTGQLRTYLRTATATRPSFDEQMKWVLPLAPGERYAYTNAAYLVLGAVIEEASGQDYESYCRNATLTPLGVHGAALDPRWRILASYGGWRMPLSDYGRFYQAFAQGSPTGNPAIGPAARRWMMSPEGKRIGGGAHYGLGTLVRPTPEGGNFWHWGSWAFSLTNAFDGPLHIAYATFAVRWSALDVNIAVYMDSVPPEGGKARNELDIALGAAARRVARWP